MNFLTTNVLKKKEPTRPNCSKYPFTSSIVEVAERPPTKIFFVLVTICTQGCVKKPATIAVGKIIIIIIVMQSKHARKRGGHLGAGFPREGDLRVNLNKK
jgi:hypothetical protein